MIKVCKWWDEFENATSRKLVTIRHFNCPSGNDSKGYRTLMREGKDGVAALGVFQALAQCLASLGKKARERGEFINSDATNLEINDISDLTRIPKVHLEAGIETLVGIGWLSHMEPRISQSSPIVPQQSPTDPPSSPNGEEGIGGERIGEEGISCPLPDAVAATPDELDLLWKSFPQISRTRSSMKQVRDEWKRIKVADRPTLDQLTESLAAWNQTEKWREGYSEGVHLWFKNRKWENAPEIETTHQPDLLGGRTASITKIGDIPDDPDYIEPVNEL